MGMACAMASMPQTTKWVFVQGGQDSPLQAAHVWPLLRAALPNSGIRPLAHPHCSGRPATCGAGEMPVS